MKSPKTNSTDTYDCDVLILGAGISGLSAAHELKKKKFSVKILEARGRIGGRVWSAPLGEGLVGEYGAEWIGSTHTQMRKFAKEFGLTLLAHTFTEYELMFEGENTPDPALKSALIKLEQVLSKWKDVDKKNFAKLDSMSLWKFLSASVTAKEMKVLNEIYSEEFGQDIRYVSAVRAVSDHLTGGKNTHMDFRVKGGNTRLVEALAKHIGKKNILLNSEVLRITQDRGNVFVECSNGARYSAKKIICTLPTQVIARTHFSPTMSVGMRSVARNLKYGHILKTILLFPERFWGREDFSQLSTGLTQYTFHATQGQRGKNGALCIYAVGKRADKLGKMSMHGVWAELKKTFPKHINIKGIKPIKMWRHSWRNDRFVLGAYAVYQPKEWARVQRYFTKPYGHIHFAGEYLAEMQGFMEGAARSGIDEAKKVTKEIKTNKKVKT